MKKFLLLLLFLLVATSLFANEYKILVTRVVDGDTVEADIFLGFEIILHKHKIRFANLMAPEKNTPEGVKSMEWLVQTGVVNAPNVLLVTGKAERDKYGRVLGRVLLNQRDLGLAAIDAGMGVNPPPNY